MLYQLSYQSRAATRDRTRDLQIFSLTLSQLSYSGENVLTLRIDDELIFSKYRGSDQGERQKGGMGELNPRPLLP